MKLDCFITQGAETWLDSYAIVILCDYALLCMDLKLPLDSSSPPLNCFSDGHNNHLGLTVQCTFQMEKLFKLIYSYSSNDLFVLCNIPQYFPKFAVWQKWYLRVNVCTNQQCEFEFVCSIKWCHQQIFMTTLAQFDTQYLFLGI